MASQNTFRWQPGGCCGCSSSCATFINVGNCNGGIHMPGTLVEVWTDSTKTTPVASGIAIAVGTVDQFAFSIPKVGNYWVRITAASPRFQILERGVELACGSGASLSPLSAPGYLCFPGTIGCAIPVSNTLTWTDSLYGSRTLVYGTSGGSTGWNATAVVTVPRCFVGGPPAGLDGFLPARQARLSWSFNGAYFVGSKHVSAGNSCPYDPDLTGGVDDVPLVAGSGSYTCPPGFTWSGLIAACGTYPAGASWMVSE